MLPQWLSRSLVSTCVRESNTENTHALLDARLWTHLYSQRLEAFTCIINNDGRSSCGGIRGLSHKVCDRRKGAKGLKLKFLVIPYLLLAKNNFNECVVGRQTNELFLSTLACNRKENNLLSYLCVRHCPWNSECNCLQRRLYQPRKEWDTTVAKIKLWEGSDLVSGNFWKMV